MERGANMSLIKCPECGKEISNQAKICPNCGYEIKHKKVEEHPIYFGFKAGIFILLVITFVTFKNETAIEILGISLEYILAFWWLIIVIILLAILLKRK